MTNRPTDEQHEYTVVSANPVAVPFHTDAHPECFDVDCDCTSQKIADLTQAVRDGLATPDDATRILQGKTV